jgi:hypothetical protein
VEVSQDFFDFIASLFGISSMAKTVPKTPCFLIKLRIAPSKTSDVPITQNKEIGLVVCGLPAAGFGWSPATRRVIAFFFHVPRSLVEKTLSF